MAKNPYVCIVKAGTTIGLMMTLEDKVAQIHGFESGVEGVRYFEHAYNRMHRRGYEASMSAVINAISFQPSIVSLSIEEIKALEPASQTVKVGNVSGRMLLLPLNREKASSVWDAGDKPDLISR